MTDDRKRPDHDDLLDTRIRSLVATAVADAPPAPTIDETTVSPLRPGGGANGDRRWIAGGLAGLSVAAAIAALFFISRPDDVTTPIVPADQPATPTTVPVTVPATEPEEQTEDAVVEVDPDVTATTVIVDPTTATAIESARPLIVAGPDGVTVADSTTNITDEPMRLAVRADDGRTFVQATTVRTPDLDTTIWVVDPNEPGVLVELDPPSVAAEAQVRLHDVATIDGQTVLLITTLPDTDCANGTDCIGGLHAWWPDTGEVRTVVERNVFEGGWGRLSLADNGLIVGTEFESASHWLYAAAVPGTDPDVPAPAELGLEEFYGDCTDCPNSFATDRSGNFVGWLVREPASDVTSIVVRWVDGGVDVDLTGDGAVAEAPGFAFAELVLDSVVVAQDGVGLIGTAAVNPAVVDPQQPPRLVDLITGETVVLDGAVSLSFG